jgi:hydroxymethylbilane synthase
MTQTPPPLTIGTRASNLALAQATLVQHVLEARGLAATLRVISTRGDREPGPITQVGQKGVFTRELEEALLSGSVDLAVHSLKDLPVEPRHGLMLAAIPPREEPSDALVVAASLDARDLASLPRGARVGTSSIRRGAQLLFARPDLSVLPLRGNVDTRLRKLDAGDYDAIVLAAAGLIRLGLASRITSQLPISLMTPAPGQGALAIQMRDGAPPLAEVATALNDPATADAVNAERALLLRLGGGCELPIGACCMPSAGSWQLHAAVCAPDGSRCIRASCCGSAPSALIAQAHEQLMAAGAADLLR